MAAKLIKGLEGMSIRTLNCKDTELYSLENRTGNYLTALYNFLL